MKHILYCEDTPEGIFSAVHRAYRSRWGHSNIEIRARNGKEQELEFFTETEEVLTDRQHAESVRNALIRQFGSQAYDMIMDTALSDAADKADVIYHFLVRGFENGERTIGCYTDHYVARLNEIDRRVSREAGHWNEFLRFHEHLAVRNSEQDTEAALMQKNTKSLMTARITPQARVTVLIMPHFADRFPEENFLIYDAVHDEAGIHTAGAAWYLTQEIGQQYPELVQIIRKPEETEEEIERLWKVFFDTIEVKPRHNEKLQQSLMPLRFRE